jgi:curved DNA-binding protein CbpA
MADSISTNYYGVLGVTHTATAEEIKSAFLKLAAEYQAQGKPANIDAVERFRTIVRAYHVLGNEEQRRRYDRLGEAGVDPTQIPSGYDLDRLAQLASPSSRWGRLAEVSIPAMINDLRILTDTDKD